MRAAGPLRYVVVTRVPAPASKRQKDYLDTVQIGAILATSRLDRQAAPPPAGPKRIAPNPRWDGTINFSSTRDSIMSFASFERVLDQASGLFFLLLGAVAVGAFAVAGI